MANNWSEPRSNYIASDEVKPQIFNELAENEKYLKEKQDTKITSSQVKDADISSTIHTTRTNISTTEKLKTAFGKIRKWFADLGLLAFKSSVGNDDITDVNVSKINGLHDVATTGDYDELNNKPNITKQAIGLSNVANERQYSSNNEPPYPVSSVNGQTGQVALDILTINQIANVLYPVGSIKMTTTNINPETYLIGSWVSWGQGKVPVGVDENDSSFDTVEKSGGSKNAVNVSHKHTQSSHNHSFSGNTSSNGSHSHTTIFRANNSTPNYITNCPESKMSNGTPSTGPNTSSNGSHSHSYSGTTSSKTPTINYSGASGTNKNLQPYITCYMWKRTS